MRRMWRWALFVLLASALFVQAEPNSSQILKTITDDYWNHGLQDNLYLRIKFGLPITKLPDPSYESAKKDAAFCQSILNRLNTVKQEEISHEEVLSAKIIKWECSETIELLPFFWHVSPVTPYASSLPTLQQVFQTYSIQSKKDQVEYLALLKKVPDYIRRISETVYAQDQKGIRIPQDELQVVIPFLRSFGASGEESPFYSKKITDTRKLISIIDSQIHPEFQKLLSFLEGDYKNKAPDAVGVGQYPEGKEFYRAMVRYHTTMDVTPEQVHEIGLQMVQKLQERMKSVRDSLNFQGTQEEFHQMLKKDPKFIPKTAEEIGERMLSYDRRIEPKIPEYFSLIPKAPHTVKRLDPKLEGSMTFGYYQVPTKSDPTGTYFYNGSNLPERPLFNSGSVVYHELVPGHHFQINLQSENESLPMFRRNGGHTAFVEGWAEYSSGLAEEMGMYQDPYELYGRLAAEMFLTVRLVVDTGMNYYGWSRAKAMDFMKANLLESETQIKTESLRYSCDIPGQALGYKMGSTRIRELREKAKAELKDRFDIRKFHAAVLGSGSMPMTVLEEHINWFVSKTMSDEK